VDSAKSGAQKRVCAGAVNGSPVPVARRRDYLDAIEFERDPPIDVIRATDFTIPGIIAHEAAEAGGRWLDVPRLD
jgi:hypothetical protein